MLVGSKLLLVEVCKISSESICEGMQLWSRHSAEFADEVFRERLWVNIHFLNCLVDR